ncbi:MAG: hypothetical protein DI563_28035 [Variovorax paradoxus]|uniref:Uncharacterized protein n=1 Tax=Variovorax paradoxus TaxID=34073 RepID=A0A2W5PKK4_VARPD|nr:MAG: hypothetical protein DI563_28035 [Variovorax paradoxus]
MAKKAAPILRDRNGHAKALADLLHSNSRRHRLHQVFSDFCEMAAISMSNVVDQAHREKRERRYMTMIGRYDREEEYFGVLS